MFFLGGGGKTGSTILGEKRKKIAGILWEFSWEENSWFWLWSGWVDLEELKENQFVKIMFSSRAQFKNIIKG